MENHLKKLRLNREWTLEYAAKLAGTSNQHLHRLESGKARLNVDWIEKFSEVYNVQPSEILSYAGSSKKLPDKISTLKRRNFDSTNETHFGPTMVPLLGVANGSSEALVLNFDEPIGEVPMHPKQKGMKGAYSFETRGESMWPRYKPGEIVYALINSQPKKGEDCQIVLNNNDSYLKVFVKQTNKEVFCSQYNPLKEIKWALSDVKAIHAVVGRG